MSEHIDHPDVRDEFSIPTGPSPDAEAMIREIALLRNVVRALDHEFGPFDTDNCWMERSPCDKAYRRAFQR